MIASSDKMQCSKMYIKIVRIIAAGSEPYLPILLVVVKVWIVRRVEYNY